MKTTAKKILMVYPEFPATYWSFKHILKFTGYKAVMPPLGLLTVAAMLPPEWQLKLVDMNVRSLDRKDVEESDLVFISSMIVQKESFDHVIEMCRECGVPVAAGGPYPTSSHAEIEGVDYFILNEGEVTLPEFLADYKNGTPKHIYENTGKPDITLTPVPRFDLINMNDYITMSLQYSRGCPFNCEFCDVIEMFGRVPRVKTPDQFISEMEALRSSGYRGPLFIVDDNFIGNKARVKTLLQEIKVWQRLHSYPFTLFTEASINMADDDELLDLMVESGFNTVFIGIETPDKETLAGTGKHQNTKSDILESVKKIQARGIEIQAGFILGFDTDKDDIFDRQIEFIQEAAIPVAMVGLLLALPHTQLHRRLAAEGRLLSASHGNNTNDLDLNFKPVMDKEKLLNGYKRVLSELYSPKKYFERSMRLIRRMPSKNLIGLKLNFRGDNVKALLMSFFKQGFSPYGYHYLKYMLQTVIFNRRNFPLAVNMAIKGYHFFKITEHTLKADAFSHTMEGALEIYEEARGRISEAEDHVSIKAVETLQTKAKRRMKRAYRSLSRDLRQAVSDTYSSYVAKLESINADKTAGLASSGNSSAGRG
jgi:radical SAM superfamily enzyme YgiQ (UPF0313 family)